MYGFFYQDFEKINSETTIEFFKKLEVAYPNAHKLNWILDNVGTLRVKKLKNT